MAVEVIRRLCRVPERLTVTEWADRYRILPETSTAPGPYDSSVTPYARKPQDCMADPDVRMLVLCWAAQTTKSTVIENGVAYRIARQPTPMVVVQPKIEHAEGWAKERFVPMVLATPELRARVRLGKGTDSTLRFKRFPGGFLFIASAASATELASRSAPFILLDEVDRFEVIPGEGNPVEIALKRQGAADVGMAALTSTPRDAETTMIWPYLEAGTYELYHVPCVHCGALQPLVWKNLKYSEGRPRTAEYLCVHCGALIDEKHKRDMLREEGHGGDARWVPTNPEGTYPSFHLNALYSPFGMTSWASLADQWVRAQGKPADLQVFVNTALAELWTETADTLDSDIITERLEPAERGVAPAGVGAITLGADVQENRVEWFVWGWGAGMESWLIDQGLIEGDTSRDLSDPRSPYHELLNEVMPRAFPHAGGGTMRISAGFIDSGYNTTTVYRIVRSARGRLRLHASKGDATQKLILGKPSPQKHKGIVLYPIGVDAAKSEFLRSQLHEQVIGPGYVHFPDWLATETCEQFVAEKRKRRIERGQVIYEWRKKAQDAANEALDCRIYARAALELLGPKVIRSLGDMAARQAGAPALHVEQPKAAATFTERVQQARTQRIVRRSGWANWWKR